ncbi:RNA degradosome polyphosphate kinase [Solemya pervernicosa gill symbiont]|uniref:Polyphosphate kinase n=1 Tax=Solemya pervernicosa gill symbiont TaxID=642797 RepID=A0A1T2L093_9GAMM|nr:polyphosphate kinase 1 [Solemya pervernicosa gill symbiont]OOZ38523.1 RNA degradosome polyphosphate kinase [Solemya pervernicosa gill symbiont]
MDTIDLNQPELYINRELSLLEFNQRVLEQAKDESIPLLERLRYLCISSTNLDEFFEIRVAGLKQKEEFGSFKSEPDNLSPQDQLREIQKRTKPLIEEQYRLLNEELFPLLEKEDIRFIRRADWSEAQAKWLHNFFEESLLPVLSPLGLDPAHPFPHLLNKSLNFIISLKGRDAFGRTGAYAVVQAPRALPRLIQLPPEDEGNGEHDYVFLSSVIHAYVDALFPGMKVTGCYQFRITRNSDLYVDDEEIDDLMRAVEGELASRRNGAVVRIEIDHKCPEDLQRFLLETFQLTEGDAYLANGPVNLNRLMSVCDLADRPHLTFKPFTPNLPGKLNSNPDLFKLLGKQDVLLHHPYESFLPIVDFLKQAALDPEVLAIKQTLYRTGPKSAVVDALVAAARAGKEVTVVIELRARFDEAENIALANRLQAAGAHVVYGVVGYKTHAKMVLVIRREGKKLRRYVHLGTGNYHPRTARLYTDYGLMTSNKDVGEDVQQIFGQLTSLGRVIKLNKLLSSPFTLHDAMIEKIEREIEHAKSGKDAHIIIKTNSLTEPQSIRALYRASMAGVKVDLIVRGVCRLRPGIEGVSENIRVRSIIGRFLEHTRVFYFHNGDEPEVFCASADWMDRNFFRRVETCFPVIAKDLRARVIHELGYYLNDSAQAWLLNSDGSYQRAVPEGDDEPFSAQRTLLAELGGG